MDHKHITSVVNETDGWDLRERGAKDAMQHNKRVKEAIRKNLKGIISEEAIITSDGTKRVKIPLRYLEQYRFKYGNPQQSVGQGQGQPGDVIGRRSGDGNDPGDGQAGDQPGEHTYEVEVSIDDLAKEMLADLKLPWLEQKPKKEVKTTHVEYTDRRRKGPWALWDKKASLLENAKRHAARRDLPPGKSVGKWHEQDVRFRAANEREELHANAAVYMLMDCSGSMTTGKRFIAHAFFFWMVRFLRIKYQNVECVFIAHDTDAQIVPEKEFFTLSGAGGTVCSSALKLALEDIKINHPTEVWNNYLFFFSDGDNIPSDNVTCKTLTNELLLNCNMMGYGEIRYGDEATFYGWVSSTSYAPSSLQTALREISNPRLVVETIKHRDDVYPTLQKFLAGDQESAKV